MKRIALLALTLTLTLLASLGAQGASDKGYGVDPNGLTLASDVGCGIDPNGCNG